MRMVEILRLLFLQVKDKLDARFGCFEVLACDFLLKDDNLSPVLMEVNANPSLTFEMEDSREFIRTLMRDVITLVADLQDACVRVPRASPEILDKVFLCKQ